MSTQKFKTNVRIDADLILNNESANTALILDASKNVISSPVTSTELGYLSGVTLDIQTQLDDKIDDSEKGAANGVATLDAGGKIPATQLPNSIMEFQGQWNASSNTPTLADGTGNAGDVYRVNVAGTQDLGSGNITFAVGDWLMYSGTVWQKADNTDSVVSVNGQQGTVVLDTDDISEGATNLYFTDERAQDAVGAIVTNTASVDLAYNDGANEITATVLPAGVDHNALNNYVLNEHIDHSLVEIATGIDSGLTGGGNITTTRNLSVDINGTTAETVADNADAILIYDASATALRKMTRANFLTGVPVNSAGDINETSFALANNVTTPANVTGLAFANATVRSFEALVSVEVDATADLFEVFTLRGVQKGSSWDMSVTATGDDSLVAFTITNAGQVQYTSGNYSGFSDGAIKFRAITTTV